MLVVKAVSSFIEQLLDAKHCSKHFTQQPHEGSVVIILILHIKKEGSRKINFPKSHSSSGTEQEPEPRLSGFRAHSINYYSSINYYYILLPH